MSEEDRIQIPGAIRKPKKSIDGSMIWLYGEPKIGKTTTAAKFPGVWFIATERGQDFVEAREPSYIDDWGDFIDVCATITAMKEEANGKPIVFGDGKEVRTLVIDTLDLLFKMCSDEVCRQLGVEDLGELAHGKGWARLNSEFERVMTKVRKLGFTVVCISHARQKEFKTKGRTVDRWEPYVGAAGYRWCLAAADLILYAHTSEEVIYNEDGEVTGDINEVRKLICHPQSWCVAGGRMVGQVGLPEIVDLDYDAFMKYFPDTRKNK